jgi:hypothetical protein
MSWSELFIYFYLETIYELLGWGQHSLFFDITGVDKLHSVGNDKCSDNAFKGLVLLLDVHVHGVFDAYNEE